MTTKTAITTRDLPAYLHAGWPAIIIKIRKYKTEPRVMSRGGGEISGARRKNKAR